MKLASLKNCGSYKYHLVCASIYALATVFVSAQSCTPPPSGIVSWWAGQTNTVDRVGGNNGTWSGAGPSYGAGKVGEAFSFNGGDCVTVPDAPDLHFTNAMTVEAWVNPSAYGNSILVKYDAVPDLNQSSFSFSLDGGGHLSFLISFDGTPANSTLVTSTNTVPLGQWSHVAGTFDSSTLNVYINGQLAGSLAETNAMFPGTDNLAIGANVGGLSGGNQVAGFTGLIDEPSLYNQALTASEIAAIYNAGSAGKCTGQEPPTISAQPQSQTVYFGSTATFTVAAAGSPPLLYQWSDNNGPIFGETNYSLSVPDAQEDDTYFVTISNSYGHIVSSDALLTAVTPTGPSITVQPQPTNVIAGSNALFTVTATGSMPLTYQWQFNDAPIAGATMSSLTITNAQPAEQGNYSVIVSNIVGPITSLEAFLTVELPPCTPPPAGLVSWWSAEGSTLDQVGGNNGSWSGGGPDYEAGEVGSAFNLNGSDCVTVPDAPNLHFTNAMTAEAWVNPSAYGNSILVKYDAVPNVNQSSFSFSLNSSGQLYLLISFGSAGSTQVTSSKPVPLNQWTHVAGTYDSRNLDVYINGVLVGSVPDTNSIFPGTDTLGIGANVGGLSGGNQVAGFTGLIDEASLYNRALTASEIAAIYNAGSGGKCTGPVAPTISSQPQNQTVFLGSNATFNVIAAGSPALLYQWSDTNGAIVGATNDSLTITNAQKNDSYFVEVSNGDGSVVSSNASLTVVIPTCTTASSGLVSWWAGQSNTLDQLGGNSGTWSGGGPSYAPGEVGTAFSFNGSDCVRVADSPDLHFTNAMTAEAWVNPSAFNGNNSILVKYDGTSGVNQSSFSFSLGSGGVLSFLVSFDGTPSNSAVVTSTNTVALNQWTHVAATFDSSNLNLYMNGVLTASHTVTNGIFPGTDALGIGANIGGLSGQAAGFTGLIDEPSVYNKALSASQMAAIYNAGPGGKCPTSVAPSITIQPQNQTVGAGSNVTFSVRSAGTIPLEYQWEQNSSIIAGATNSSVTISNAQLAASGSFVSVSVRNLFGSVISSNAVLTVTPPPSVLIISNMIATSGIVTVPLNFISQGEENTIGFSVNFNSSLLTFISADVGTNDDATLIMNTNQVSSGLVGLGILLPLYSTFNAGTNVLGDLTFQLVATTNTNTTVTPLKFGNTPVPEQEYDATGNPLIALFTNGNLTIPFLDFEGDVFPVPNGDAKVLLNDWIQMGRFVAGLDAITNGNEFQRADCAPRSTLGDGRLTVSDWVQAGRYAGGFDPLTVAGGPTSPQGGGSNLPPSTGRSLSVANATVQAGQPGQLSIKLAAQGDENGLEFSLSFPPSVLTYVSASLGSNDDGAYLLLNTNRIASGQLGVLLGLPVGESFATGSEEVLKLTLKAATNSTGDYSISFGSQPLTQEVSDMTANAVSSSYYSGLVSILPLVGPRLSLNPGKGNGISFSYPASASGFILQSTAKLNPPNWTNAVVTLSTNGNTITATAPANTSQMFYRLISP